MSSSARLKDLCTGHGPCPPRPIITASENVFVNYRGSARKDDFLEEHCGHVDLDQKILSASPTVFVNHRQMARIGDPITCGGFVATGSLNVYTGPTNSEELKQLFIAFEKQMLEMVEEEGGGKIETDESKTADDDYRKLLATRKNARMWNLLEGLTE